MGLKSNVLVKLNYDKMRQRVLSSLTSNQSPRKINKKAMTGLLISAGYQHHALRDIDIYRISGGDTDITDSIVLDNELTCYRTSLPDVLLRKSPTLKEMINIRNAIKILNDSDVVTSKREVTLDKVYHKAVDTLELNFSKADILTMFADYEMDFRVDHHKSVLECLAVFSELSEYVHGPVFLEKRGVMILCKQTITHEKKVKFGPFIFYDEQSNHLKQAELYLLKSDKHKIQQFESVVTGKEPPSQSGRGIFQFMIQEILGHSFSWPYKYADQSLE